MVQGGLAPTQHNLQEEVGLSPKPVFKSHLEETGFHTVAQEFQKIAGAED